MTRNLQRGGEQVDQLAESKKAAENNPKPVLEKGEVWDPFGDESKI